MSNLKYLSIVHAIGRNSKLAGGSKAGGPESRLRCSRSCAFRAFSSSFSRALCRKHADAGHQAAGRRRPFCPVTSHSTNSY